MEQPNTIIPADEANIPAVNRQVTRGDNVPPGLLENAESLKARFAIEYAPLEDSVSALLLDIRDTTPAKIETDQQDGIIAAHMESLRKTIKAVLAHHDHEKAEYLAAGRFCDQHFFAKRDRLETAQKILQARGDDYTERKVAEKRQILAAAAAAEAKKLQDAAIERRRLEQQAAEAAAAAERARKPENIERHQQAAEQATEAASLAQIDELIAASRTENAVIAAQAPSAAIARTRHASGHLSTARQVGYAELVDINKIDLNVLRPYIKPDHLEQALKAWAKITDHKVQMDGARIGKRDAGDYR